MARSKKNAVKAVEDKKLEVKAEDGQTGETLEMNKEVVVAHTETAPIAPTSVEVEPKPKHKPDEVVTIPFYFPRR